MLEHGKPEHAEGAFYIWTHGELSKLIGHDVEGTILRHNLTVVFNYYFGVQSEGNIPEYADPHGELKHKNHLKITHSLADTAKKFHIEEEQVRKELVV